MPHSAIEQTVYWEKDVLVVKLGSINELSCDRVSVPNKNKYGPATEARRYYNNTVKLAQTTIITSSVTATSSSARVLALGFSVLGLWSIV